MWGVVVGCTPVDDTADVAFESAESALRLVAPLPSTGLTVNGPLEPGATDPSWRVSYSDWAPYPAPPEREAVVVETRRPWPEPAWCRYVFVAPRNCTGGSDDPVECSRSVVELSLDFGLPAGAPTGAARLTGTIIGDDRLEVRLNGTPIASNPNGRRQEWPIEVPFGAPFVAGTNRLSVRWDGAGPGALCIGQLQLDARSCHANDHCIAPQWCWATLGNCVSRLSGGSLIPVDPEHESGVLDGTCSQAAAEIVCRSAACNERTDTCASADGTTCTGPADCASDHCLDRTCLPPDACLRDEHCPPSLACDTTARRCVAPVVPDAGAPDAGGPDGGDLDAGDLDAGATDGGDPDGGDFDAGDFDAGDFDAGDFDGGAADASEPDAGDLDAGGPDAGSSDAGEPADAGTAPPPPGGCAGGNGCAQPGPALLWALFALSAPRRRRSSSR